MNTAASQRLVQHIRRLAGSLLPRLRLSAEQPNNAASEKNFSG
jgi:hypothetical protein